MDAFDGRVREQVEEEDEVKKLSALFRKWIRDEDEAWRGRRRNEIFPTRRMLTTDTIKTTWLFEEVCRGHLDVTGASNGSCDPSSPLLRPQQPRLRPSEPPLLRDTFLARHIYETNMGGA